MDFRITFYETANGDRPVVEFLESFGLIELRVGGANIARIFFSFRPGQEIVCTNGYVKKSQRLDPAEIGRAEQYRADWERRHS